MTEKETVFSSKTKYDGIFDFREFYRFCYDWLLTETDLDIITETKYSEKIEGNSKNIDVEWKGSKEITDYFRFDVKVEFRIIGLTKVELNNDGRKIKTNNGSVEMKIKGELVRDYKGQFEMTASRKFMRSIYEKWIIPARIEEFEARIAGYCDEFLSQAKAFLDLEGKR